MNVLVDGVDCEVKEALSGSIRCVTGKKDSASLVGYQPGQPGLKRVKNNADSSKSFVDQSLNFKIVLFVITYLNKTSF